MSGPSDKAREAAVDAYDHNLIHPITTALKAAHDPALGLDRSVCLREVVEWLREHDTGQPINMGAEVERKFAGAS